MYNSELRHYQYVNDYVKLYFFNGVIRYVKASVFMENFHDFLDLSFEQIRNKYKIICYNFLINY